MNNPHSSFSDALWACVEEGFHVGSRSGDFLGHVDRQPDGRYSAFDARSRTLGTFSTLEEATTMVSSPQAPAPLGSTDEELKGAVR